MINKLTKPRPGIAFKNGKFYDFRARRIGVIRAWPDPLAWVKTPKHGWKSSRVWADKTLVACFRHLDHVAVRPVPLADYQLRPEELGDLRRWNYTPEKIERHRVMMWGSEEYRWKDQSTCIQPFIEQIPVEIRTLIAPLEHNAWHLLSMLARCPRAIDLFHNNPALAFALSSHWIYRPKKLSKPMRATRSLVYKKQRVILDWMGFPGSKSVQQIFRKIQVTGLHPYALKHMKAALKDPIRHKVLSHLPVITPEVLGVVGNSEYFSRVTMRFLMEMIEEQAITKNVHWLMRDTLLMDQQRGGGHTPAQFNSIRRLRESHADLVTMTNNVMFSRDRQFPPPPYDATEDFEPITTLRALFDEGMMMRHCVASHGDRVCEGAYYVYRVLAPVRATLAIVWRENCWHVSELQGPSNSLVPSHDYNRIVASFFANTCLRGPIESWEGDTHLGEACYDPDYPPLPPEPITPVPWVPCDQDGHPLLLFSDESKAAVDKIQAIFANVSAA